MYREIKHGDEARQVMAKGMNQIAETVKHTMGVRGKNVVLDTHPYANPTYTNDGVTIAQELIIQDRFENIGAKLIREVATKTNDTAGDGTTTAMVLMQAIVQNGMKALAAGADSLALRKGIKSAVKAIVESVQDEKVVAKDKETLAATATISCRDKDLGDMIADIVMEAGTDGMINLEDSFESETTFEKLEGLRLRGGIIHEHFINQPESKQASFNNVPIIVTNQQITTAQEMGQIMECLEMAGQKQGVLIANGIEGDALATAAINWQKKTIQVLPIRVMAYGDLGEGMLKDVATITGASYIDGADGKTIMKITSQDFGLVAKIVADRHETTVVSDNEELKEACITDLKASQKAAREFEKENIKERIAKLRSAMFTVKVGGVTESERKELKTRVDDAIHATRAAFTDGVVAGGGSALYRASRYTEEFARGVYDEGMGYMAVLRACEAPIEQMAVNSSIRIDSSSLKEISDKTKAIDFTSGEVVDAFKQGIIDPLKVVTETITNAASGAISFLTTEAAVVLKEPPQEEKI